jgi:hypothetical protein
MRILLLSFLLFLQLSSFEQPLITRFEQSNGTESPGYPEIISWWMKLAASSNKVKMLEMGPSDAGFPLHLILISGDKDFNMASLKKKRRNIILINNGIHPGEPDGIDASMLLAREIIDGSYRLPATVVVGIIPVYNIGGSLNRSRFYRIDQDGPVEKGFRGNAENLDLNRDFIKADSKNAMTFSKIFHYLDPDVFIDTHVSNGADYQHVMTLLAAQHNKLGGEMGAFMNKVFEPGLYPLMKTKGYDLVPYVNHYGGTVDKGWSEYWDSPRYSSGYASLWSSFAFETETHMLKPYKMRVESTKAMLESFIEFTAQHSNEITRLREDTKKKELTQPAFPIAWKLDKTRYSTIHFKGFQSGYKPSEVSGLPQLYYDRSKPYEKQIPFYNYYLDSINIQTPVAYIIPQGWWKVIERLKMNNVQMRQFLRDTMVQVESYKIQNYESGSRPFEGHHLNIGIQVKKAVSEVTVRKGDYYIPLNQTANRFLVETLEPQGEDSYFSWNFFDAILGQKEGFSDYVFEQTASNYLKAHPSLREELDNKKATDTTFAKNGYAQLDFVFRNSPYYETAHMQYPVYRVMKK